MTAPTLGAREIVASAICQQEWRPVVGYEGLYEVSDQGRVRSIDRAIPVRGKDRPRRLRGQILALQPNSGYDYLNVSLSREGVQSLCHVHSLVAAAFLGPRPADMEVAHNDGCGTNNHVSNLRYATHKDNLADTLVHGTHNRGERHSSSVLTAEQVQEIRSARARGEMLKTIAASYGIAFQTVSSIARRKAWAWLPDEVAS